EEPKDMPPQGRLASARGTEEPGRYRAIGLDQRSAAQHGREGGGDQEARDQPGPSAQRHPGQRQSTRAALPGRRNALQARADAGHLDEAQAHEEEIDSEPRVLRQRYRWIEKPTRVGHRVKKESTIENEPASEKYPEAERAHPRKSHFPGSDDLR